MKNRKNLKKLIGLIVVLLLSLMAWLLSTRITNGQEATPRNYAYLPLILSNQIVPAETDLIDNPSFEESWEDLDPVDTLINQRPNGWNFYIYPEGSALPSDPDSVATGVPEAIHKHSDQLPANEQIDGSDPLILEGDYVYKVFHFGQPFATVLSQTIEAPAYSTYMITVPVRIHSYADPDCYGAEVGFQFGTDEIEWFNHCVTGDRQWFYYERGVIMPIEGKTAFNVYFKSKWFSPKDFFIDDIQYDQILPRP